MRSDWVGCPIGSLSIPKMLLSVAMLAEQVSRKGTTARFAAYDIVSNESYETITVGTSFSGLCGHAIGYHGEWKMQLEA